MWDKIKTAMKGFWEILILSLGAIAIGLAYMLRRKQDEVATLKAKDQLNEADKQSALLDKDIEQKQAENAASQSKIAEIDQQLVKLEEKQKTTKESEKTRPDDQVEDYWKNN